MLLIHAAQQNIKSLSLPEKLREITIFICLTDKSVFDLSTKLLKILVGKSTM